MGLLLRNDDTASQQGSNGYGSGGGQRLGGSSNAGGGGDSGSAAAAAAAARAHSPGRATRSGEAASTANRACPRARRLRWRRCSARTAAGRGASERDRKMADRRKRDELIGKIEAHYQATGKDAPSAWRRATPTAAGAPPRTSSATRPRRQRRRNTRRRRPKILKDSQQSLPDARARDPRASFTHPPAPERDRRQLAEPSGVLRRQEHPRRALRANNVIDELVKPALFEVASDELLDAKHRGLCNKSANRAAHAAALAKPPVRAPRPRRVPARRAARDAALAGGRCARRRYVPRSTR